MADGVTQLLSANVQLDSALTQLEQGLRTLESSRASALEQADLSGALNIQTITALLTAQNFSMPAGYLQEDGVNYMVSVGDSISSRQELSDMVLFDLGLEGVVQCKTGRFVFRQVTYRHIHRQCKPIGYLTVKFSRNEVIHIQTQPFNHLGH